MVEENESRIAAYLRILEQGPRNEGDWPLAAELIDGQYAKGSVHSNRMRGGSAILDLHWEGPTMQGREYADRLRQEIEQSTPQGKSAKAVAWIGGITVTALITALVTKCVG